MPAMATQTRPTNQTRASRPIAVPSKVAVARPTEPRLESLTSLRFFAASMILLLHTSQLFGFQQHTVLDGLALWQGVSFFFVLSGFILAYVYPKIDTPAQSNQFLLARFARIWPTHFAAFLLTIALVPTVLQIPNVLAAAVANLCMVQVWAFNPALSESFNSVSWTISIELFFYLSFPFLIKDFNKPLKLRWLAAAALSLSFIALCMVPHAMGLAKGALPTALYLGENPICRLFEFTLGIGGCWLFKNRTSLRSLGVAQATSLEILCIAAIGAAISLSNIWPAATAPGLWSVFRAWAIDMGGAPAYAGLILIVATEKGLIAQFLNKKFLVRLGEISFSMYMYHLSILYALIKYQSSFANLPGWLLPTTGVASCLIVSHLNFSLIETPVRKWIMSLVKPAASVSDSLTKATSSGLWLDDIVFAAPLPMRRPSLASQFQGAYAQSALWLDDLTFTPPTPERGLLSRNSLAATFGNQGHWLEEVMFAPPRPKLVTDFGARANTVIDQRSSRLEAEASKYRQAWIVAEVAALFFIVLWVNIQFRFIPAAIAQRIESHSIPTTRDIEFGGRFKLRGLKVSRKPEGVYLDAVWESLGTQKLKYLNALQVIDAYGKTLSTRTYPQDYFNRSVSAGKIWEDKAFVPQDKLDGALRLGLSLHAPPDGAPLKANQGVRDGDNVRLLVALPLNMVTSK